MIDIKKKVVDLKYSVIIKIEFEVFSVVDCFLDLLE